MPSKSSEPTSILRKDSLPHKRPKLKPEEKYQALRPVLMEKSRADSTHSNDMETPGPLENVSRASESDVTSGHPDKFKQAHHAGDRPSSAGRGGGAAKANEGRKAQRNTGWVEKEGLAEDEADRPRKKGPQQRGKSAHQESRWSQRQFNKADNLESLAKPKMKKESALANSSAVPNASSLLDSGGISTGLPKPPVGRPPQKFIDPNNMRWKIKMDPMEQVSQSEPHFEND